MNKRRFSAEDFMRFKFVSDPQLSSDGNKILYVSCGMEDEKYLPNIWMYDLKRGTAQQFTFTNSDENPRWSPDCRQIAFNSRRKEKQQLYLMPASGGEAQPLVEFRYGVNQPVWSPCGKKIAFTAPVYPGQDVSDLCDLAESERDKELQKQHKIARRVNKLFYKCDGYPEAGLISDQRNHIFVLDLASRKIGQLTEGNYSVGNPSWSPTSDGLVFSANITDDIGYGLSDSDIWYVDLHTKDCQRLTNSKGPAYDPVFSADGNFIAYLGHRLEYSSATNTRLFISEFKTGEVRDVIPDFDYNLEAIHLADMTLKPSYTGPVWSEDGRFIYFTYAQEGNNHLAKVEVSSGTVTTITSGIMQINGYRISTSQHQAVVQFSNSRQPGEIGIIDLVTGQVEQLTAVNQAILAECYVAEPEEIWIKGDEYDVQGWILKPFDFNPDQQYPLILEVHGGPHCMYTPVFFFEFQLLAAAGFVVLFANPRGSQGYGQQFAADSFNDFGGKDYEELMRAVDYAEKLPFVDSSSMGVTGGSYGGYMTAWIIAHSDRFKAAVAQRGVYNWLSFCGVSDCGTYFSNSEFGYYPWENPDKIWDMSPLKYAKNIKAPLLLIHSESDIRSCMEQADQLYVYLKALKRKVEMLRFPGEGHNLSRSGQPNRRVARLKAIIDWFETHM